MTAVEFCCGAGGSGLGLARAGIRALAAYDSDPRAVATYNANLAPVAQVADVREVWRDAPEADLWVATLPCQPFSSLGKRLGDKDARDLFPWLFGAVAERRPAWVLIENVPGVLRWYDSALTLRGLGYRTRQHVQCASDFGVPQPRRRLWCVATTTDAPFRWPEPQVLWERDRVLPRAVGVPLDFQVTINASDCRGARRGPRWHGRKGGVDGLNVGLGRPARIEEVAALQGLPKTWRWPFPSSVAVSLAGEMVPPAVAAAFGREIVAAHRAARAAAVREEAREDVLLRPDAVIEYLLARGRTG